MGQPADAANWMTGRFDGSTGGEGFGWLNDLIGNRCHLEGMFDGGCGNGGGGNAIIIAKMAVAVEVTKERGWGGDKKCNCTVVEYCKKGGSLLVTGGGG